MDASQRRAYALLNVVVMPWWLAMIVLPRSRLTGWLMERLPVLLAALGVSYIGQIARVIDSRFLQVTDPDAMRGVLASPEGFLAGWIHYVACDVVVGRWIWRTAQEEGRGCRLALFLTWTLGPAGVTLFLAQRRLHPVRRPAPAAAEPA